MRSSGRFKPRPKSTLVAKQSALDNSTATNDDKISKQQIIDNISHYAKIRSRKAQRANQKYKTTIQSMQNNKQSKIGISTSNALQTLINQRRSPCFSFSGKKDFQLIAGSTHTNSNTYIDINEKSKYSKKLDIQFTRQNRVGIFRESQTAMEIGPGTY